MSDKEETLFEMLRRDPDEVTRRIKASWGGGPTAIQSLRTAVSRVLPASPAQLVAHGGNGELFGGAYVLEGTAEVLVVVARPQHPTKVELEDLHETMRERLPVAVSYRVVWVPDPAHAVSLEAVFRLGGYEAVNVLLENSDEYALVSVVGLEKRS